MNPSFQPIPRSCRGGFLRSLLFAVLFLGATLVVAWVFLLPLVVKKQVTAFTGCPAEVDRFNANPFGGSLRMENLVLENPAGQFPHAAFLNIKLVDCQIDPMSLRAERLEIPRLHLDLGKITVVRNKEGVTNLMQVKQRLDEKLGPSEGELKFHIGDLVLRLEAIETIDYSAGAAPVTRTVQLGINQHLTNVDDVNAIIAPILTDILTANAAALNSMLPPDLQKKLGGALKEAAPLLESLGGMAGEKGKQGTQDLKKLFDSLQGGGKP